MMTLWHIEMDAQTPRISENRCNKKINKNEDFGVGFKAFHFLCNEPVHTLSCVPMGL